MLWKLLGRTLAVFWIGLRFGIPWIVLRKRRPELTRRAFEELGSTYVKLGQIVASSPGLFPQAYVTEFQKCLDRVPPFPFEQVQQIVESELGKPMNEAFAEVTRAPIAAASIAQVHAAKLPSGQDVVIKVQRPKIRGRVDADLWFMHKFAWIAEKLFLNMRLANATGVIEDFHQTIHEELDFKVEARNMDQFNEIMAKHGDADKVCAPYVYWDHTTTRLLTMERFHGFKADDVDSARGAGLDTEHWLRIGMRSWNLTMMLHGFFHGDVHAGNLMLLPDREQIGFIDFGIVGRFTDHQRMQVLRYVLCFSTGDYTELAKVLVEMGAADQSVDTDAMAADLNRLYAPLVENSLSELDYGSILPDIVANSRKHGIRMPREFILILKQLLYFDRYAKLAAPNLNVFNDVYLMDFMFTPAAGESGLDMVKLGKMLMQVQKRMAEMGISLTPAAPKAAESAPKVAPKKGGKRVKVKVKARKKPEPTPEAAQP